MLVFVAGVIVEAERDWEELVVVAVGLSVVLEIGLVVVVGVEVGVVVAVTVGVGVDACT